MHRLPLISFISLLGIALFLSWYLPDHHGLWYAIDKKLFFYFNHKMVADPHFADLVALVNKRAFDLCSLLAMGLVYGYFFLRADGNGRRRLLAIGITMLLSAVVLNQLGHLLPVSHHSPSLVFGADEGIVRIKHLTSITTKDASSDSFPGDHGMMLMVFCAFMLRYCGRGAFMASLLIVLLFSLPRVMIGAHWFTDIAVGSLSVVLTGLSWWLMTGASDRVVKRLQALLPRWPARHHQ